jgi:phage terminase small subunit
MVTNNKQTELTPKQIAFAKEYTVDRNGTQAAIRAGYSRHTANEQSSRLLAKVHVKEQIAIFEQDKQAVSNVDAAFVINGLRDIAVNGKTESNRVRSYELLGKTLRMFVDVSENTVTHDVAELQQFTLAQLTAMREQAALRSPGEPIEDVEVLPDAKEPHSEE